MDRMEAIDKATEIVENLGKHENNSRGYKIDGWKPPTATERTDAILRIAAFLIGPSGTLRAPLPTPHPEVDCPGSPEGA